MHRASSRASGTSADRVSEFPIGAELADAIIATASSSRRRYWSLCTSSLARGNYACSSQREQRHCGECRVACSSKSINAHGHSRHPGLTVRF
jgi:hypothetical protein